MIDTITAVLQYNWTSGDNEALIDYDITSLSFWRHSDNANDWNLLIGTENGVSVIFVENQAPTWPDGSTLTDSNVGLTSLTLVWAPAEHNIGVAEYLLFEDSEFIDNVTGEVLSYDVNGLDPNTEYTFKVEACDGEGNCSTDGPSVTVWTLTPVEATGQLVVEVLALNLQGGIENSLEAKLDTVLKSLDDLNTNNDVAAINSLQAFINAVEAQRGHKIPEADADNLIAAAQEIIDLLSAEQTE